MGKKADAEKEEEYEYTPPDFDEDAFIHKELTGFRTTVILFLWAVAAGLVSWLVYEAVGGGDRGWYITILLAVAFGFALKFLFPRLGADIRHYGRKEWLGTGFMFFFAWLSVLLIALNPPVADDAEPVVEVFLGPPVQQTGNPVTIDVVARDNEQLAGAEMEVALVGDAGRREVRFVTDDFEELGHGHWRMEADLPGGTYEVRATATDEEGLTNTTVVPLRVTREALRFEAPRGNAFEVSKDRAVVWVPDSMPPCTATRILRSEICVRTVYLDMVDSDRRVVMEWNSEDGNWEAGHTMAGWQPENNTFDAVAEMADRFFGKTRIGGQSLRAGPWTVDVQVTVPGEEEKKTPEVLPNMEAPPPRQVPGIAPVLLVGGLLTAAFVARRRWDR